MKPRDVLTSHTATVGFIDNNKTLDCLLLNSMLKLFQAPEKVVEKYWRGKKSRQTAWCYFHTDHLRSNRIFGLNLEVWIWPPKSQDWSMTKFWVPNELDLTVLEWCVYILSNHNGLLFAACLVLFFLSFNPEGMLTQRRCFVVFRPFIGNALSRKNGQGSPRGVTWGHSWDAGVNSALANAMTACFLCGRLSLFFSRIPFPL